MDAVKIVNKINKEHGTIKNVYFLACGGSLVDLYPGYYFVRAESARQRSVWRQQKQEWMQVRLLLQ